MNNSFCHNVEEMFSIAHIYMEETLLQPDDQVALHPNARVYGISRPRVDTAITDIQFAWPDGPRQ